VNLPVPTHDLEQINAELTKRIALLLAEVAQLKKVLFGQKRERVTNSAQLELLSAVINDAIAGMNAGDPNAADVATAMMKDIKDDIDNTPQKTQGKSGKRGHGRRDPDDLELPIQRVEIDPPEVINNRDAFEKIGEQVSSHVEWLPSSLVRVDVVLNSYRRIGDGFVDISTAEMPIRFIDKSIVGPSFVANSFRGVLRTKVVCSRWPSMHPCCLLRWLHRTSVSCGPSNQPQRSRDCFEKVRGRWPLHPHAKRRRNHRTTSTPCHRRSCE
jgi:hypothetical protein